MPSRPHLLTWIAVAAFILIVGVYAFLGSIHPHVGFYATAVMRGAERQLYLIYVAVDSEIRHQISSRESANVQGAVEELSRDLQPMGADYFRLQTGTNHVSVCLNPNSAMWASPSSYADEVAGYWPMKMSRDTNSPPLYIAVLFSGTNVQVAKRPSWKPISIPE
jgi:hypothetical protein